MSTEGQHNCVLCNSKLGSKQALQEHFRKHANKEIDTRGRPVKSCKNADTQCDICDKSFDTITATIRHRFKMHPNSPTKFYCSYCGKQFPLRTHRDNHQISHDSSESKKIEQHKKCMDCDMLFYNERALNYHYRSIHKRMVYLFQPIATPPPSNKIKLNSMNDALSVYYCHLCGAEYVIKFNLQQHLEKAHTRKERDTMPDDLIKCTVCSALFYNKKAYNVHNSYHQPNDLYVTSEQQRVQTVTKVDQDFDIRRVEAVADKYIPRPKRPLNKHQTKLNKMRKTETEDTKSESSSDDPTGTNESSDSESDIPLQQRIAS
ncbi:Zinc finger and SCAN domain-containing protein 12 [Camponotus floridanus]|uniref:Zinc finger and SCAN domain-containing protein 12 n=1 Tax=Camponotus floridanus TaxID=104421 RepID=E2A4W3_CAMFO|nr:PR domain zinc finger protein 5 [Camponotus floridanus]EFN71532.1 Zinc finger and SCAN domain-containing protein 12 [Camponotus floridanus]